MAGIEDSTKSSLSKKEQKRLQSIESLFAEDDNANCNNGSLSESDDIFRQRLQKLNNSTPFEFVYNDIVKSYIRQYASSRKTSTGRLLGLSQMYFPLFEEHLSKNDLPDQLKYLAVVESSLNPKARSYAAAVGLWQFMPSTGKLFGLKMNAHIDERADPHKATQAACKYLKSLYNIFGNWELALAAYNSGPGTVSRAIRQSGGKRSYWEIYEHLPKETRGYVPAFIAVNYIMTYHREHGIETATPDFKYCDFDTVTVRSKTNLAHIANAINEPVEVLKALNPSLKSNNIPATLTPFTITIPRDKSDRFAAVFNGNGRNIELSYEKEERYASAERTEKTSHKVRRGETLASISRKYGVSVNEIKAWNKLRKSALKPGQRLTIKVEEDYSNLAAATPAKNEKAVKGKGKAEKVKPVVVEQEESLANNQADLERLKPSEPEVSLEEFAKFHIVQKGDTLWSIAQQYEGLSVSELKKMNNINGGSLKPGQKLIISVGG